MRNLLRILGLYKYSISFWILVIFSFFFLLNNNLFLKSYYFNSSNYISGTIFSLRNSFIELMNNTQSDEVYKILLYPIQKRINERIRIAEEKEREEDLRIRKEYGIKDDEDWFDGRWGIKVYKRSK